ncbi:Stp1/IreP family PP2C-type Ser/Thr phosphatase [Paucilactobacillus nenjiangensis]|uniref:protein-serine/threonine phosphatase n=1 Tax=Paucilactobacillus nenjiangensis TaxID=1296540 RepID=A0A5P1X563_9LACO|nr:Stp1/IreP family PP2C-type Ser/Thr phosphatase [Paucilactobacillus nenjiangensis]QER67357.1 Stp1/IreP family PP2C-type Ser/Thr phosphatase [Paucilactobacillus nenjiangensis]
MKIAFQTDVGQQREDNQDYVGTFTNDAGLTLAIIADGIGGHQGGDVASTMAVTHMGHNFEETNVQAPIEAYQWLATQVRNENQTIIEKANKYKGLNGMGTTLVAAILFEDKMVLGNIGDSRGYLLRNGEFNQLTEDHSLVNELVKKGVMTAEEAQTNPKKNIITRTIGISKEADTDISIYRLDKHDQLLLCTDGLSNMVSDDEIAAVLSSDFDIKAKCQELIAQANQAGGPDNITVLIADNTCQEETN